MVRANRLTAAGTCLVIIGSTTVFAYGYYLDSLEKLFSYELDSLTAKFVLGLAMIVIMFFVRPRWIGHRILLGTISTAILGFAAYCASVGNLLTGDAIIYAIGAMVAAFEATEISSSASTETSSNRFSVSSSMNFES